MSELKPCQYCGHEAEVNQTYRGWQVECPLCGVKTANLKTQKDAIAEWNSCQYIVEGLKPCPFCGSEAKLIDNLSECVKCPECGAYVPKPYSDESAQDVWNKRVQMYKNLNFTGIKVCPLCTSKKVILSFFEKRVYCEACRVSTKSFTLGTYEEAIDAWNRRSP